jgi:hypothetical protein
MATEISCPIAGQDRRYLARLRGQIHSPTGTPRCNVKPAAKASITSAEVKRSFQQRTDDEMERPVFMARENVREFLMQMCDYRNLLVQLDW